MGSIVDCLASNVKRMREGRGWTQAQLASEAGISLIFLQSIEAKRKWVSPVTAKAIAEALEVTESELFENCFDEKGNPASLKSLKKNSPRKRLVRRLKHATLEHIPDDIYNHLATTCRDKRWKWEVLRWLFEGHERTFRKL